MQNTAQNTQVAKFVVATAQQLTQCNTKAAHARALISNNNMLHSAAHNNTAFVSFVAAQCKLSYQLAKVYIRNNVKVMLQQAAELAQQQTSVIITPDSLQRAAQQQTSSIILLD